jgi:hypothetical protein
MCVCVYEWICSWERDRMWVSVCKSMWEYAFMCLCEYVFVCVVCCVLRQEWEVNGKASKSPCVRLYIRHWKFGQGCGWGHPLVGKTKQWLQGSFLELGWWACTHDVTHMGWWACTHDVTHMGWWACTHDVTHMGWWACTHDVTYMGWWACTHDVIYSWGSQTLGMIAIVWSRHFELDPSGWRRGPALKEMVLVPYNEVVLGWESSHKEQWGRKVWSLQLKLIDGDRSGLHCVRPGPGEQFYLKVSLSTGNDERNCYTGNS